MMLAKLFSDLNMEWNGGGGGEMEERISIRNSSKPLKKYGSTAKHMTRNENLVKHIVTPNDTFQGIALKYGVTTEQIRRVNRLWASDSLFLREYLLIPVPGESCASLTNDVVPSDSDTAQSLESATSPSSITSSVDEEGSIDDFLAKMDSSIASMKKEVKRAQGNSDFGNNTFCHEGDDTFIQRRRAVARLRNSHPITSTTSGSIPSSELSRPSSSSDVHNLPSAVVMTQGRKVKTSLQRLQQQQDEMFQL